ncbi:MAG: hypothetical protein RL338_1678 [Chloroflexota bacterium]|jgi:hypothetical protein
MDARNDLLGELAADAALERTDFLVQAADQLTRFLNEHAARIREIGGMTLIDDDPDFLSVAPDLTFRSRSRYLDDETGEWVSETEVIESAAELVELYNPADLYEAFAAAARTAAGLPPSPTATDDLYVAAGIAPEETVPLDGEDPYAAAAASWAAGQVEPTDEESAAQHLYDLALAYQERSQRAEARLLEDFEADAIRATRHLGDVIVRDADDERLTLEASGGFRGEVVPEGETGEWRPLATAEELVEFYDPTDIFGELADALADAFPAVAGGPDGDDEGDDGADGEDDGAGIGRA